MLAQQILNGVVTGSIYALFALGFTLVFGINGILNLAHGALFMSGAFFALLLVAFGKLPLIFALLAAAILTGLLAVLLDLVAFRPLRRRGMQEFSAIVSSIGAGLIITSVAQRLSGTRVWRFPFGAFPIVIYDVFGLKIQLLQIVILVVVLLSLIGLNAYLYRTDFGKQVRAVAVSERTAQLLGIDNRRVFVQVFFVSGALAGLAGTFVGLSFSSVSYVMGDPFLLRAFVIVVLGGMGSLIGGVLASLLIGVVQSLSVAYLSAGATDLVVFSLLFVALLIRPTGMFGKTDQSAMRVHRQ